jgi:hypothetical protein
MAVRSVALRGRAAWQKSRAAMRRTGFRALPPPAVRQALRRKPWSVSAAAAGTAGFIVLRLLLEKNRIVPPSSIFHPFIEMAEDRRSRESSRERFFSCTFYNPFLFYVIDVMQLKGCTMACPCKYPHFCLTKVKLLMFRKNVNFSRKFLGLKILSPGSCIP